MRRLLEAFSNIVYIANLMLREQARVGENANLPLKETHIVSGAQTKFGRLDGVSLREMFVEAVDDATMNAGIPKKDIQAAFIGTFIPEMLVHQGHTAPLLLDYAGMKGLPATRHEAACASGATALRGFTLVGDRS